MLCMHAIELVCVINVLSLSHACMHAGGSCHGGRRGDCVRFPVVSKNEFSGCSHMLVSAAECHLCIH